MFNRQRYLVRFSTPTNTDLDGMYLDAKTQYAWPQEVPIMFDHGFCPVIENRKFGTAKLERDNTGILIKPSFEITDDYSFFMVKLFMDGRAWWSSGTDKPVKYQRQGSVIYAPTWSIQEASITPYPAEPWLPQNPKRAISTKSYAEKKKLMPKTLPSVTISGMRNQPKMSPAEQWYFVQVNRNQSYMRQFG